MGEGQASAGLLVKGSGPRLVFEGSRTEVNQAGLELNKGWSMEEGTFFSHLEISIMASAETLKPSKGVDGGWG